MFIIRRALQEDAKAIHEAHMNSIREVCSKDHTASEISGWGNRPFNEEQRIKRIEKNFIWVALLDNQIEGYAEIGFFNSEDDINAYIYGLYLTKKIIGNGVGENLLNLMIAEARNKNVKVIKLESTITAHNFYKKFGFVNDGVQANVQIGGSDVRCFPMKLELN